MTRRLICLVLFLFVSASLILPVGCGSVGVENSKPVETSDVTRPDKNGVESSSTDSEDIEFSFIVCGDPQNNYDVFDKIVEAARGVDILIIAGDLTGSGTPTEFQNFLSYIEEKGINYYAIPGNHDVATHPIEVFEQYIGPRHRAFKHKNGFFILFDNSEPARGFDEEEQLFVEANLPARSDETEHIFAVCHVPPGYPYSLRGDSEQSKGIRANESIVPVLSNAGVDTLFCGHFHAYERSESEGLEIVITGGAGAPLQADPDHGGYYHYVLVKVAGAEKTLEVIKI